jgi:hypothetical protein
MVWHCRQYGNVTKSGWGFWNKTKQCRQYTYIVTLRRIRVAIFVVQNLHEIRKRKANWISHILRRNCLLKQVINGKIKGEMEVTRRRGRRRKQLLNDLKDRRGYSHLKEKAIDRTMCRNSFGIGFGPVVRQNTEWWWFLQLKTIVVLTHCINDGE